MLQSIKSLLGFAENNNMENKKKMTLDIAVAAILIEIADTDGEFKDVERDTILDALAYRLDISKEDAEDFYREAVAVRNDSNDLWQFTNYLNNKLEDDERFEVLEEIWRVILSDGKIDAYEDLLVRRFTSLLHLDHEDLIEAKMNIIEERKQA